jgi:hypothetical protein
MIKICALTRDIFQYLLSDILTRAVNIVFVSDFANIASCDFVSPLSAGVAATTGRIARKTSTQVQARERNMALHQVKELGWVSFWVVFIIALFGIFIPTVNRALNL